MSDPDFKDIAINSNFWSFCTMSNANPALMCYSYVAPPPIRCGTATRKILDSCYRTLKGHGIWGNCNEFNGSQSDTSHIYNAVSFADTYASSIKAQFPMWLKALKTIPGTRFSSGGQTMDLYSGRNVTASQATYNFTVIMQENLQRQIPNDVYSWLVAILELMEMDMVEMVQLIGSNKRERSEILENEEDSEIIDEYRDYDSSKPSYIDYQRHKVSHEEFLRRISFLGGFIKQKERGQLESRSIVSCTIPFKVIVFAIEELVERMLTTISALNLSSLGKVSKLRECHMYRPGLAMSFTVDNTKWNEMINIGNIAEEIYHVLARSGCITEDNENFIIWLTSAFKYIFELKSIDIGNGISLGSRLSKDLNEVINITTDKKLKSMLEKLIPYWSSTHNSIRLPYGMVMGMANKASTLHAYINTLIGNKLQASDDMAAILYLDDKMTNLASLALQFENNAAYEGYFGMNNSADKSYGIEGSDQIEYNSLIMQGEALINISPDLPALLPVGKNPIVDFNAGMKIIREMRAKQSLPFELSSFAMNIFFREYRKAYHCIPSKHTGIYSRSSYLHHLGLKLNGPHHPAHGGELINSPTSLHLDPIAIAYVKDLWDKDYIKRLCNPNSPMAPYRADETVIKFDAKKTKHIEMEFCPSALNWVWRENRTAINSEKGFERIFISRQVFKSLQTIKRIAPDTCIHNNETLSTAKYLEDRLSFEIIAEWNRNTITMEEKDKLLEQLKATQG